MKTTQLLLLLAMLCAACSQPSTIPIPDEYLHGAGTRLESSRFFFVDQSHYTVDYTYASTGLLDKETQLKTDGSPLFITSYEYDNGKIVAQHNGAGPRLASFIFRYQKDSLVHAEYEEFRDKPEKQHFTRTYSYPEKDIVMITEKDLVNDKSQYILLYMKDGNTIRTKTLDPITDDVKEETAFEYDNHPNPYYGLTGTPDFSRFRSKNNVTAIKTLFRNGVSVQDEVRYAYDYLSNGLPAKKYQVLTGNKKLAEQEYIYSRD
nr:hypothetical protein [uncultured Dyadobacter sp.]